ncbi:hypothetical protein AG1IA_06032 [Rhizoctonia solani AG-1 IA]|uniref:Uncharacterized protein n=1 Tax=Thanatephorus cucumeris (strain AG1-IA) TaxID=983506 RepID=L8WPL4_THACA|nr:hypothetical protein AG1IA_06032 [Rhizoctonia solani AG-1 IA]
MSRAQRRIYLRLHQTYYILFRVSTLSSVLVVQLARELLYILYLVSGSSHDTLPPASDVILTYRDRRNSEGRQTCTWLSAARIAGERSLYDTTITTIHDEPPELGAALDGIRTPSSPDITIRDNEGKDGETITFSSKSNFINRGMTYMRYIYCQSAKLRMVTSPWTALQPSLNTAEAYDRRSGDPRCAKVAPSSTANNSSQLTIAYAKQMARTEAGKVNI